MKWRAEQTGKIWTNIFFSNFFEFSASKILLRNNRGGGEDRQNVWLPGWWYSFKFLCFASARRGSKGGFCCWVVGVALPLTLSFFPLQTLCALIRGVHQKNKSTSGFDIINMLVGFDKAELCMKVRPWQCRETVCTAATLQGQWFVDRSVYQGAAFGGNIPATYWKELSWSSLLASGTKTLGVPVFVSNITEHFSFFSFSSVLCSHYG